MQNNLLTWAIIFLSGNLVLSGVIIYQLSKIRKSHRANAPDEKYWELKQQIQTLKTTFTIVGAAIIFLGWNVRSQITSELKTEVMAETKKDIDSTKQAANLLKAKLEDLEKQTNTFSTLYTKVNTEYVAAKSNLNILDNEFQKRFSDIKTLLRIYLVKVNVAIPYSSPKKIYFKEMKPINSQLLPVFKNPPVMQLVSSNTLVANIGKVTNEYVEVQGFAGDDGGNETFKAGDLMFWIVDL